MFLLGLFQEIGTLAEHHKAPEAGNSPGPGPEVVKRQKVAKERAAQRVRSWTVR